jgi:hypothetical protein
MAICFFASARTPARMARCTADRGMPVTSAICRTVKPAPLKSSTTSRRRAVSVPGRVPLLAGRGSVFSSAGVPDMPKRLVMGRKIHRAPARRMVVEQPNVRLVGSKSTTKRLPCTFARPRTVRLPKHPLNGREMRELRRHQRESPASSFVFVSQRDAPLSASGFARMIERARCCGSQSRGACPHAAVCLGYVHWPARASIPGRCRPISAIAPSTRPRGTPRWHRGGSRTFGGKRRRNGPRTVGLKQRE